MTRRYLLVFERTETGYCAYAPDLRGCVSTGRTRHEAETNLREAIDFHIQGLRASGATVPEPATEYGYAHCGV